MSGRKTNFFVEMNLSADEISTFKKYIDLIEAANNKDVGFLKKSLELNSGLLVQSVFTATHYFKLAYCAPFAVGGITSEDFQVMMKGVIKDLHRLEQSDNENVQSLELYSKLRKEVLSGVRSNLDNTRKS